MAATWKVEALERRVLAGEATAQEIEKLKSVAVEAGLDAEDYMAKLRMEGRGHFDAVDKRRRN